MADAYAREGPAHDSELAIRFRVLRVVSSLIAGRHWRDVVPIQKGISVSFTFCRLLKLVLSPVSVSHFASFMAILLLSITLYIWRII